MKNLSSIIGERTNNTSQAKRFIIAGAVKVNGEQVLEDILIDENVHQQIVVGKNKIVIDI